MVSGYLTVSLKKKSSVAPAALLLNSLHWLPVHSRINFKIATITYKSLHSQTPGYLASMLHHYMPARNLCSSNSLLLSSHPAKKISACMLFNLPHQTSGTNYQLTSSLHVPYHLSKPTLKLIIFSEYLDGARDRTPQIRLPHQNKPLKSRILAGYLILDFTFVMLRLVHAT